MVAINPALMRDVHKVTAGFYEAGISCQPLVDFNRWIMSQPLAIGEAAAANDATHLPAAGFDTALATALESSGAIGVDITDLRVILKPYDKTTAAIGAALGRMKKAGTAEQRGSLWYATTAGKPATAATVDKSIDTRRRNRKTATGRGARAAAANAPAGGTEAEAEPTPQAAAAG